MQIEENKTYMIWAEMNVHYINDMGYQAERAELAIYPDFIKQLSPEIKTIIAFYSKYIRFLPPGENTVIANALGNFLTVEDAQAELLKNREELFAKVKRKLDGKVLGFLNLVVSKNTVSFEYLLQGDKEADRYTIRNGEIRVN